MDLFVTAEDVRNRMGLDGSILDNTEMLDSAILGAQHEAANMLMTDLQLTPDPVTDTFVLDPDLHSGYSIAGLYKLFLTRGFLRLDLLTPTVEVSSSSLPTSDAEWTQLNSYDYMLHHEKGLVFLPRKSFYTNKLCRVTYKAGYQTSSETPDEIPSWLQEMVIGLAPVIFNIGPTTKRNPEAEPIWRKAHAHALNTAALHLRDRSLVHSPVITT